MVKNLSLILIVIISAIRANSQETINDKDILKLYNIMSGSFNSKKQSKQDSTYFEISLNMVPVWKDKGTGYWLYVEQAMGTSMDKPYRQRFYHLTRMNDTIVKSEVYSLKNPDQAIGAWKNKNPLSEQTIKDLELRDGCAIYLKKTGRSHYVGSTKKSDCPSNLRGAAYATSKVEITKNQLNSWDQGFDKEGKQVWGATSGPYEFKKVKRK